MIAERYEIRDRIGRGAFGEVFEVYDHRLKRLVALKTLPIDATASAEATEDLRRFHMEASSVARLSHPGIVTVHDFGETKDFAWIVMELVIGETLKSVLDQEERPSLSESVRVTCALLDALHYAHGRGIVHRDVKPANILLSMSAEEGLGEVRLADFGIARIGESQQTVAGQIIGTPTAMSPEQVRGEDVDLRSDLWSAGVILYQLLTGTRPFSGGMPGIFNAILTKEPPPPSEVMPDLPSTLDEVIATALAKNPKDRYPDAAAMAAALRKAAAPWPTPGMAEQEAETIRVTPAPVAATATPAAPPTPTPVPAMALTTAPGADLRGWFLVIGFAAGLVCGGLATHLVVTRNIHPIAGAETNGPGLAGAADPMPASSLRPVAHAGKVADKPVIPPTAAKAQPPEQQGGLRPGSPSSVALEPAPAPPAVPPLAVNPPALAAPVQTAPAFPAITPLMLNLTARPAAPAAGTPAPPIADGALPICTPEQVVVRSGNHRGYSRIVFNWPGPMRPELQRLADGALLRFPGADCLPDVERLALPRNVLAVRPDEEGRGLRVAIAPDTRLRLTPMSGNLTVVDVLDGAE